MRTVDMPVEAFDAVSSDGRTLRVERMESRHEVREPMTGRTVLSAPFTWYRCMGAEFTAQADGSLVSDAVPGLVLRRR